MQDAPWVIRKVVSSDEIAAVSRFRYEIYVEGQGDFVAVADHERRQLTDIHDMTGTVYSGNHQEQIVGSIRINDFARTVPTVCLTSFDILSYPADVLSRGAFVSRAVIRPDWRKTALFASLVTHMMREAVQRDVRFLFIEVARNTSTTEAYLSMYKAMGFRFWRPSVEIPDSGPGAILVINLEDEWRRTGSMASAYLDARKV